MAVSNREPKIRLYALKMIYELKKIGQNLKSLTTFQRNSFLTNYECFLGRKPNHLNYNL